MHSSSGLAISADDVLQMTPPEVLRYLLMKQTPRKHIDFEITLFQRERGSRWLRAVELLRQFAHPFDQVVRLAANAGLRLGRVTAGYADDRPVAPDAMRWVIEARRS